jgi:hypothetical protein
MDREDTPLPNDQILYGEDEQQAEGMDIGGNDAGSYYDDDTYREGECEGATAVEGEGEGVEYEGEGEAYEGEEYVGEGEGFDEYEEEEEMDPVAAAREEAFMRKKLVSGAPTVPQRIASVQFCMFSAEDVRRFSHLNVVHSELYLRPTQQPYPHGPLDNHMVDWCCMQFALAAASMACTGVLRALRLPRGQV